MITLYGVFEFTALAGAFGLAAHHTLTRVLPLRRALAAVARRLGRGAGLAWLERWGERLAPAVTTGTCASGCGSCGGCASSPIEPDLPARPTPGRDRP